MTRSRNITHGLLFLTSIPLLSGSMVAGAADKVSFNEHIRPIFMSKCTKCHGGAKTKGDLSLIYRSEVLGKGKSGKTIIVPGKPAESKLYTAAIAHDFQDLAMPPVGHRVAKTDTDNFRQWIIEGAEWPDGPEGTLVATEKAME